MAPGSSSTAGSAQVFSPLIFISYSHKDADARSKLETHLAQLKREGVQTWFDDDIVPGAELDPAISRKLRAADIFVALASPDYLHSNYCFEREYGFALRKAARGKLHVVVAILHACQWKHTKMARYKALPHDGRPVDKWKRHGDAFEDIVEGLRRVVKQVRADYAASGVVRATKVAKSHAKAATARVKPKAQSGSAKPVQRSATGKKKRATAVPTVSRGAPAKGLQPKRPQGKPSGASKHARSTTPRKAT